MSVPKSIITAQLKAIGAFDHWFTKKEIKYLPEIINEDETIKAITSGLWEGNTWLIVVTQRRVLFLDKGMIYGLKQVELPISQISAIVHKTGLVLGEIIVSTSGGAKHIKQIRKQDVVKFAQILSDIIKNKENKAFMQQTDIPDQIKKISDLKEQGILTEEEFQKKKGELLAKM